MNRIALTMAACLMLISTPSYAYPLWLMGHADCLNRQDPACVLDPHSPAFVHEIVSTHLALERVNRYVNDTMEQPSGKDLDFDKDRYGKGDFWISGQEIGDCEDLQLTKLLRLRNSGYSRSALRMAIVDALGYIAQGGDGSPGSAIFKKGRLRTHAILLVYTDKRPKDPYVLDNMVDRVQRLSSALKSRNYRLKAFQDANGVWNMLP